jgi:hypothetical protein
MYAIHVFISIRFARTDAAAILKYFESFHDILSFGIAFKQFISSIVNFLPNAT